MPSKIEKMLEKHIADETVTLDALASTVANLRDNHLEHVKISLAEVKTEINWLKWLICTTLGAGMIAAVNAIVQMLKL
jgi:hypothetical protein